MLARDVGHSKPSLSDHSKERLKRSVRAVSRKHSWSQETWVKILTLSLVLLGPGQAEEHTLVYAYLRKYGWEVSAKMKIPLPTRLCIYSLL